MAIFEMLVVGIQAATLDGTTYLFRDIALVSLWLGPLEGGPNHILLGDAWRLAGGGC